MGAGDYVGVLCRSSRGLRNSKVKRTRIRYKTKQIRGRGSYLHRLRAEIALGRPLQGFECVHHADGSIDATAPLVICPDNAYHRLLHQRLRVKLAGGNPDTDKICCACQQCQSKEHFWARKASGDGLYDYCKPCANLKYQERRGALLRS